MASVNPARVASTSTSKSSSSGRSLPILGTDRHRIPTSNLRPSLLHARRHVVARNASDSTPSAPPMDNTGSYEDDSIPPGGMSEPARKTLIRATKSVLKLGWVSFWAQLTLSVVSAVILLFSVAFTSQSGPRASLYLTLIGILCGFLSTFWNWGYTRTGMKMQQYLDSSVVGSPPPKIKKQSVLDMVTKGVTINVIGLGSTLLGIQALVGVLVAKTLSNATANPFIASAAGVYNPVLALDVFLVQAATNTLLGHFLSMVCSLWLLNVVGEGRGLRFQRLIGIQKLRERLDTGVDQTLVIEKGNKLKFTVSSLPGALAALKGPNPLTPTTNKSKNAKPSSSSSSSSSSLPSSKPTWNPPGPLLADVATATAYSKAAQLMGESEMKKAKKLASINGPSSSSSSSSLSSVFENPSPSYLDGLPGNFGFDPLGIYTPEGTGVMDQTWLRYSEVYHSRWAMLGVAGCLVPEIRGDQIEWFKASYEAPYQLYAIPILLLAAAEYLRIKDFWEPRCKIPSDTPPEGEEWWEEAFTSCATGDPIYPGGPLFNFSQIVRDKSSNLSDFKESEVVAGRIAMVAFVGFVVQGVAGSGVSGPYGDLLRHLDDPIGENFVTLLLEKNAAAAKAVAESSVEGSSVKEALSNGIGGPNAAPLVKDGVTRLGYQMNLLE